MNTLQPGAVPRTPHFAEGSAAWSMYEFADETFLRRWCAASKCFIRGGRTSS